MDGGQIHVKVRYLKLLDDELQYLMYRYYLRLICEKYISAMYYVQDLATTAENAASESIMRQLYDTTKNLVGEHNKPERPMQINH